MSESDQIKAFVGDLQSLIDRYRNEFDLKFASVIGCIEIVKLDLFKTNMDAGEDSE